MSYLKDKHNTLELRRKRDISNYQVVPWDDTSVDTTDIDLEQQYYYGFVLIPGYANEMYPKLSPVEFFDASHCYGPAGGCMYVSVKRDSNRHTILTCFGHFIFSESSDTWGYFVEFHHRAYGAIEKKTKLFSSLAGTKSKNKASFVVDAEKGMWRALRKHYGSPDINKNAPILITCTRHHEKSVCMGLGSVDSKVYCSILHTGDIERADELSTKLTSEKAKKRFERERPTLLAYASDEYFVGPDWTTNSAESVNSSAIKSGIRRADPFTMARLLLHEEKRLGKVSRRLFVIQ